MPRTLSDVFGISRDVPDNYVTRDDVDGVLVSALTRDKHLVIFGSSKQGKTCLRKWNLRDDEYVVITCASGWNLGQLLSATLKQVGFVVEGTTTRTVGGGQKIAASFKGGVKIGPLKGEASIDGGADRATSSEVETTPLELDPSDVNDIISALESVSFDKFIVLEDFHYLSEDVQKEFAVALKAFHEHSKYCFIIVGVWLDENRLIQFNGDLAGRVLAVDADKWTADELRQVVQRGEELLGVEIDPTFVDELVAGSFQSVFVVQEVCFRVCEEAGIVGEQGSTSRIAPARSAGELIREVVNEQSARYTNFLSSVADGFQESSLQMYRYLIGCVLIAPNDALEQGLSWNGIRRTLATIHPEGEGLNPGNITQSLFSIASLQVRKNIKPIILDYDQTRKRLNVVDRGFLIWLSQQDRADALAAAGLPADLIDKAETLV